MSTTTIERPTDTPTARQPGWDLVHLWPYRVDPETGESDPVVYPGERAYCGYVHQRGGVAALVTADSPAHADDCVVCIEMARARWGR